MTYISLLRGINVAGVKKIKMADLKALYLSLGFKDVVTYIQSGNVIFKSDNCSPIMIKEAIKTRYGFEVPVQIREANTFKTLIDNCPFKELDLVEEGTRVMVTFLEEKPTKENINTLLSYVKESERVVVSGQEVYLHCPNGYGKTKLNNTFLEKKLGVGATTRNWKSVCKLYALSKALS